MARAMVFSALLAVAAAQSAAFCAQMQAIVAPGCVVDNSTCTLVRCSLNYQNVSQIDIATRVRPCGTPFNITLGFNQSSTGYARHWDLNTSSSFFVTGLHVTTPSLGNSTLYAMANFTVTGSVLNMSISLRNCVVKNGSRHCAPKIPISLINGAADFSSLNCSAPSPPGPTPPGPTPPGPTPPGPTPPGPTPPGPTPPGPTPPGPTPPGPTPPGPTPPGPTPPGPTPPGPTPPGPTPPGPTPPGPTPPGPPPPPPPPTTGTTTNPTTNPTTGTTTNPTTTNPTTGTTTNPTTTNPTTTGTTPTTTGTTPTTTGTTPTTPTTTGGTTTGTPTSTTGGTGTTTVAKRLGRHLKLNMRGTRS